MLSHTLHCDVQAGGECSWTDRPDMRMRVPMARQPFFLCWSADAGPFPKIGASFGMFVTVTSDEAG